MVRFVKTLALVGALSLAASPVLADDMLGGIDLDPFHIMTPAPAAAPAAAPMKKKMGHHKMMKHKMMKKKMGGKKKMMKKKM